MTPSTGFQQATLASRSARVVARMIKENSARLKVTARTLYEHYRELRVHSTELRMREWAGRRQGRKSLGAADLPTGPQ
jgi:hypothetical protein